MTFRFAQGKRVGWQHAGQRLWSVTSAGKRSHTGGNKRRPSLLRRGYLNLGDSSSRSRDAFSRRRCQTNVYSVTLVGRDGSDASDVEPHQGCERETHSTAAILQIPNATLRFTLDNRLEDQWPSFRSRSAVITTGRATVQCAEPELQHDRRLFRSADEPGGTSPRPGFYIV